MKKRNKPEVRQNAFHDGEYGGECESEGLGFRQGHEPFRRESHGTNGRSKSRCGRRNSHDGKILRPHEKQTCHSTWGYGHRSRQHPWQVSA